MFTKRSSNAFGCLRIASESDEPASTSWRTARMIFWKRRLSCWPPRISRHCTSGRPASIMTENWRVKIARRRALTLPPPIFGTANSLPFSLTVVTSICRRRRSAIARSFESATRTPPVVPPCRVRPFQTNCAMRPPLLPAYPRRATFGGAPRTTLPPAACVVTTPTPRAIISASSSGSEEVDMASSCEMTRRCTSVASD